MTGLMGGDAAWVDSLIDAGALPPFDCTEDGGPAWKTETLRAWIEGPGGSLLAENLRHLERLAAQQARARDQSGGN